MTQSEMAHHHPKGTLADAMKLHGEGKLHEAADAYERLIDEAHPNPEILYLLGAIHAQMNDVPTAKRWLCDAIEAEPHTQKYYAKLMDVCKQANDIDGLIDGLQRWLKLYPDDTKSAQELINLSLNHHRYEAGMAQLRVMLKKEPNNISLLQVMCLFYVETKDYTGGLDYFERTFNLQPYQSYDICKAFCWVLHQAGHFKRSIEMSEKVLAMNPNDNELYILHASNCSALKDYQGACDTYTRGHIACPDDIHMHYSVGLTKFHVSAMKEGYDEYMGRFRLADESMYKLPSPWWKGEPLQGKRLMIWGEQGIGDVIMWSTMIPWILQQEPAKLVIAVEPRMVSVLARSFPQCDVIDIRFTPEHELDYNLPMGELMRYIIPHYEPNAVAPILVPDPELVATYRARYEAAAKARGAKRIVGISWFTSNDLTAYVRNIPLIEWSPLFKLKNVQYVSLQYGNHDDDIASVNARYDGALLLDETVNGLQSCEEALAQVAAMDEVITIQNSTSHFGGVTNTPTTLLLSASSDWRWGTSRTDSLWYNSVKVERQQHALQWKPIMQAQAKRLKQCAATLAQKT